MSIHVYTVYTYIQYIYMIFVIFFVIFYMTFKIPLRCYRTVTEFNNTFD